MWDNLAMSSLCYMSLFLRWMRWYMTYMSFLCRSFIGSCSQIEDFRFCKQKEVCFFPFRKCGHVLCKDKQGCAVILKSHVYEHLYNCGVYGDESLYIDTIKRFCRMPDSVSTIQCEFYPWDVATQNRFIVDENSLFIPRDIMT